MFKKRKDLNLLNKLLEENNFLKNHVFTPKPLLKRSAPKYQFIALIRVCKPLLVNKLQHKKTKIIKNAFSKYYQANEYNLDFADTLLADNNKGRTEKYLYMFSFLKDNFNEIAQKWDEI